MRFPVKLNRGYWPALLCKLLPAANDVLQLVLNKDDKTAFSNGVCAIKIDGVFKTTKSARYPKMIAAIQTLAFVEPPVVLDIAASDGSAALSTLQNIDYKHYYITDRNPVIYWMKTDDCHFFYEPDGRCFMAATRKMVYYADTVSALWPFKLIADSTIGKAKAFNKQKCRELVLVNPAINTADERITVQQHDIFDGWAGETPNLVIAANILNFNYFSQSSLQDAINLLIQTLDGQGYLAIVDNRPNEHGSLFAVNGKEITLLQSISGGAMTESLALELAKI